MNCLKQSLNVINWRYVYFVWPLEYPIKTFPVPTKLATVVVIKVKSCQAFLRVLLLCIRSYLKSLLMYTFLIFGYLFSGHAIFTWARMWGSLGIFRSQKGVRQQKRLGNTAVEYAYNNVVCPSTAHWWFCTPPALALKTIRIENTVCVCVFFIWFSQRIADISINSNNDLVSLTETRCFFF
jgi:hypothetical protein